MRWRMRQGPEDAYTRCSNFFEKLAKEACKQVNFPLDFLKTWCQRRDFLAAERRPRTKLNAANLARPEARDFG